MKLRNSRNNGSYSWVEVRVKLNSESRIFVAGHNGMVGSAIVRLLNESGYKNILTAPRSKVDLIDGNAVREYFCHEKPSHVFLAAAKVGGIHANNTYPAEFLYNNLLIEANVINSAWISGVKTLLFLGSSCIYPKMACQPMSEESLLTGALEKTNEPYALAKIAGIKLCEGYNRQYGTDFRSVMPTNLYGPGDNYHSVDSHVIPALLRRFHEAKISGATSVTIWGTGSPKREFLFVDDLARACVKTMELSIDTYRDITTPSVSHINIGSGEEITIAELANLIADIVGYQGNVHFDSTKPDGTPRKLLNIEKMKMFYNFPITGLRDGLRMTYASFLQECVGDNVRK